jgi:hypothetical protein
VGHDLLLIKPRDAVESGSNVCGRIPPSRDKLDEPAGGIAKVRRPPASLRILKSVQAELLSGLTREAKPHAFEVVVF